MNHIETNLTELRAGIAQQAHEIAGRTTPVAVVRTSQGVGFTVADLLNLEATDGGREAIVRVVNPTLARREIAELRTGASAVVRRMFSTFLTKLEEAETEAQQTHAFTIAQDLEGLLLANNRRIEGRPLASHAVSTLVELNNSLVEWLASPQYRAIDITAGAEEFQTRAVGANLIGTTNSRFMGENGAPTHQFRHRVAVADEYTNSGRALRVILDGFLRANDAASRIIVSRHNSNINGIRKHIEQFALVSLIAIEIELEYRVAELATSGFELVVTKTPVAQASTEGSN